MPQFRPCNLSVCGQRRSSLLVAGLALVSKRLVLIASVVLAASLSMALTAAGGDSLSLFAPRDPARARASYVAVGHKAMITTAHPLATEAGFTMLKQGGNATDAAVAASFMLAVVRPQSTGIGGGGFLLYYDATAKLTHAYDFRERAPALATRTMFLDAKGEPAAFSYNGTTVPDAAVNGLLSVGVPGLVKGLLEIHSQHGKLPLAQVMAPAIRVAREGFPIYPALAEALRERAAVLRVFPGSVKVFFRRGRPLTTGETLVQKDLAWTLEQIVVRGSAGFYQGEVAGRILGEMHRGRGLITAQDLTNYKVLNREPVSGDYQGYHIVSMPPPSSGGAHIIEILNILAATDYERLPFGSAESLHLLTEAMRRAFADRAAYLGDPDFVTVPLKGLVAPAYGKALSTSINHDKATPSAALKAGAPEPYEHPSTTHLSVVDAAGNAVSTTQTINYTFGSCVVADGTGIVLNDEMDDFAKKPGVPNVFGLVGNEANAVVAGKTPLSSMSPTFVFDAHGDLRLVLGSPGGPRIISATLQTILNVIAHHMSLEDAVHASRIHHQWIPDHLEMEEGAFTEDVRQKLASMGHHVVTRPFAVGDVQAIGITPGTLTGVADTRSDGVPMGF